METMLSYFLKNSKDVFYLKNDDVVMKTEPENFNLDEHSYMFSVEQKDNSVIFVLDFDGENGLTPELWKIGCEIYKKLNKNSTTYLKPSGNKGLGIFTKIKINGSSGYNWREFCLRFAYSLYNIWDLKDQGINFGFHPLMEDEISCIDVRMFEINRKFRGIGRRKNGNYSILTSPDFDFETVDKMMKMGVSARFEGFPRVLEETPYLLLDNLYNVSLGKIKHGKDFDGNTEISNIFVSSNSDEIYKKMPEYLKNVVDDNPEAIGDRKIRHFHKLWLVQYIYHYLGIYKHEDSTEIIFQFFKKHCKFKMDYRTTKYQIWSIIKHIKRVTNNEELIGIPFFITDNYKYQENDIIEDLFDVINEVEEEELIDINEI